MGEERTYESESAPIEREPEFNVVDELKALVGVYNQAIVDQKIAEIIAKIDAREAYIEGYIRDDFDDDY